MFTGLVEEIGRIESIRAEGTGLSLWVATDRIAAGSAIGDSISVSGVCLTAEELRGKAFRCHAGTETVALTTVREWQTGRAVNLERALSASSRLGGHFVQGHVDGVGRCVTRVPEGETTRFSFEIPPDLAPYIAPKGSIAIDGISLTVTGIEGTVFAVAIIPQTIANTTLAVMRPGVEVNLEADILAKYVARMLGLADAHGAGVSPADSPLTREFLAEHGF
jgi:riboflavin synthase